MLSDRERDYQIWAASQGAATEMPTWAQEYTAARDYMEGAANVDFVQNNRTRFLQDALDRFRESTGVELPNPERSYLDQAFGFGALPKEEAYNRARTAFAEKGWSFPSDDEITQQAEAYARSSRSEFQDVEAARGAAGGSMSGFLVGLAGSVVGGVKDPLNLAAMAIGANAASGILRTMAVEAAANAIPQAANEAALFRERQRIFGDYTAGEALGNVATAAVGGAVIGGGLKAASRLVDLYRGQGRAVPRDLADAAHVSEAEAMVHESNTLAPTPDAAAAHVQALAKASADIEAGRAVDVEAITAPHLPDPVDTPSVTRALAERGTIPASLEARLLRGEAEAATERLALAQERALDLQRQHADAQAAVDALRQGAAPPEMDVAAMRTAGLDEDTLLLLEAATTERATATGRRAADLDAEIARIRETLDVVEPTLRPEAQQAVARAQREADALAAKATAAQRSAEQWVGEVARREKYAALAEKRLSKAEQKARAAESAAPPTPEVARDAPNPAMTPAQDVVWDTPVAAQALQAEVDRALVQAVLAGREVRILDEATGEMVDASRLLDDIAAEEQDIAQMVVCMTGELAAGAA